MKTKYCVACEIRGKKIKATENVDGVDLCKQHADIYLGRFDKLINDK